MHHWCIICVPWVYHLETPLVYHGCTTRRHPLMQVNAFEKVFNWVKKAAAKQTRIKTKATCQVPQPYSAVQ